MVDDNVPGRASKEKLATARRTQPFAVCQNSFSAKFVLGMSCSPTGLVSARLDGPLMTWADDMSRGLDGEAVCDAVLGLRCPYYGFGKMALPSKSTGRMLVIESLASFAPSALGRTQWKNDCRVHADLIGSIFMVQLHVVAIRRGFRDRQPEAGAFDFLRCSTEKAVIDEGQCLVGNSRAVMHQIEGVFSRVASVSRLRALPLKSYR